MKRHDLLSVGLKLLGAYVLIETVQTLQYLFAWLAQAVCFPGDRATMVGSILAIVVPFGLLVSGAVVLMRQSDPIAARMLRNSPDTSPGQGNASPSDIQAIAFSVLGLATIALAIPKVCPIAVSLHLLHRPDVGVDRGQIVSQHWGIILSVAVQILIGAVLFLRAQSIVNLWRRLQIGRYEKRNQRDDARPHPKRPWRVVESPLAA